MTGKNFWIQTAALLIAGVIFQQVPVHAAPEQLAQGEFRFQLGDQSYQMFNVQAVIDRKSKIAIMIGLDDREQKTKVLLTISGEDPSSELHLSTEFNALSLSMTSENYKVAIIPARQLAPTSEMQYTSRQANTGQFVRQQARWVSMSRKQRLATGEGVIHNEKLDGTILYVNLTPVVKDQEIVEFLGTFSGVVKNGQSDQNDENATTLSNGEFRVAVQTGK
ncbi:MAG: hypothetical protein HQM12_01930 [SAR324 cluster bacterium]|nr:hypothetical protein [SAR324 cluster bacterium]